MKIGFAKLWYTFAYQANLFLFPCFIEFSIFNETYIRQLPSYYKPVFVAERFSLGKRIVCGLDGVQMVLNQNFNFSDLNASR